MFLAVGLGLTTATSTTFGMERTFPMQTLRDVETLVRNHPFFASLDEKFFPAMAGCSSIRRFASQQVIFHEGGEADHFFLIVNGQVALETYLLGSGMVTIQTLGPGDALGWSWLFPPFAWHFTASTREPTEVVSLNAKALRQKAAEDREFHDELLTRVARTLYLRLIGTRAQLIDVHAKRAAADP
jgi:CRP-like cAMP-binding protein